MKYLSNLGIMGNLNRLFSQETKTSNNFINHKSAYDIDHITMEQQATDLDLANIIANQTITDLDLRVLALESEA